MSELTFLQQFADKYAWDQAPAKRRFRFRKRVNRGMEEEHRLALTLGGVIDRALDDDEGLQSSDYSTYQIFEEGDLVFKLIDLENIRTSRVGYVPRRGIMSPAYIRLEPAKELTYSRYYYWFFYGAYLNNIFNGMGGGVRQNLTATDLLEFPVPLPDLDTQKVIADFLDCETARIDQLTAKKERLIALLRERELNHLILTFSELTRDNPRWKLAHVCHLKRGRFNHRPRNAPELYDGGIPFLQTGDVARANKYISAYKQTLSELGASVSARFPSGTVMMAIAANVGDVAICKFDAFCPDSIVGFVPSKILDSEYLYYALRSLRPDIASSSTSNAQDNTNLARLGGLKIPIPSRDVQLKVVDQLDEAELRSHAVIEATKRSIVQLQEYRTALITAAVTGQLDVKTWGKFGQNDRRLDEIQEAMGS